MGIRIDSGSTRRTDTARRFEPAVLKSPEKLQQTTPGRTAAQTAQAQQNKGTAAARFFKDVFESSPTSRLQGPVQLAGTQQARGSGGVTPATLTSAEAKSAEEAIVRAHDTRDAKAVADWLKANPDPAKQAAFMDMMFEFGPVAGEILNNTQAMSDSDRRLLSNALNTAYKSGAVTNDEVSKAVEEYGRGAGPGETHEALASIVAGTRNADLIETYAKRELEIANDSDNDPQRAAAAATALAGMPPSRLQSFLKDNASAVSGMLENINADYDSERSPALGKLLDAASRIQPPTAESLKLFTDSIDKIGENADSRAAAARFFSRNGDEVIQSFQDASGSIGLDGQKKLSEFFTRTLFSPPGFEGQEAFRKDVMKRLGDLQKGLDASANASPPSTDAKRQARLLGSLVGTLEGGFQVAVDELNKRNDATKGMVDLLFSAKELLPNLPLPGAGKLKDLTIGKIQEWVTKSLQENAQNPEDAIPFHRAFGELIANPDLRTDYDAARGDAFLNRERGLS